MLKPEAQSRIAGILSQLILSTDIGAFRQMTLAKRPIVFPGVAIYAVAEDKALVFVPVETVDGKPVVPPCPESPVGYLTDDEAIERIASVATSEELDKLPELWKQSLENSA